MYNPATGKGDLSLDYLKERAAFIERKNYYDLHDANYIAKSNAGALVPDYNLSNPYKNGNTGTDAYAGENTLWANNRGQTTVSDSRSTSFLPNAAEFITPRRVCSRPPHCPRIKFAAIAA